jgi:phosphatidylserine/phosphatidylglycerophosphate/cardiolipin synthase-like enzyme
MIVNSVLTSDNFPAQSIIDMDTVPRLLFNEEQQAAWLAAAGKGEKDTEFVSSEEWSKLVNHPQIFVYETGRLDSVLLGEGGKSYGKLHAKLYQEDQVGFVGTTNFDYRSRLYNNEMGFFFISYGLSEDINQSFEKLKQISYRWGSPEWLQLRQKIMDKGGTKGRTTARQRALYKFFRGSGFIWYL